MPRKFAFKPVSKSLVSSPYVAIIFLTLAAIVLVGFQNDKVGFEQWHHGFVSSHGMSIAKNISKEHNFLMFMSAESDGDTIRYKPYNRFPIFPFLCIKAATLLGTSLSEEIYLARQLMNLFVVLAMVFVYLALYELTEKRYLSILVALLSFSSYFVLYYSDMIFNDSPSLAGFTGMMYGIAVYEKTGKRRRLFGLAIFAVSMGWQVFSLLAVWWVYSLGKGIFQAIRAKSFSLKQHFPITATLVVTACILFGGIVLGASLYNESRMVNKSILETPSARQIQTRMGLKDKKGLFERTWLDKEQMRRIAVISTPYKLVDVDSPPRYFSFILLALIIAAPLLLRGRDKLLLIAFGFSGFVWAIAMHNFTKHHDFQALYYIGIPIAIWSGLLGRIPEKINLALCLAALAFFVYANIEERNHQNKKAKDLNQYTADFEVIGQKLPPKSIVFVDKKTRPRLKKKMTSLAEGYYADSYYLAGRYYGKMENADFIVTRNRKFKGTLLTPENKFIFLFEKAPSQ